MNLYRIDDGGGVFWVRAENEAAAKDEARKHAGYDTVAAWEADIGGAVECARMTEAGCEGLIMFDDDDPHASIPLWEAFLEETSPGVVASTEW